MKRQTIFLLASMVLLMFGFAYASVPLYRLFCQVTGYGGTPKIVTSTTVTPIAVTQTIHVRLEGSVSNNLPWRFHPLPPTTIDVVVGEPVLAFYEVSNESDTTVTGIATYNMVPQEAAVYFNKIQCFCFEEQQLEAKETIEMPVLFFIHPDILQESYTSVTLSYTFFPSSTKLYK